MVRQRHDGQLAADPPPGPGTCTCADWLPVVRPHLAEILVDGPALERIRRLARLLPGDAASALEVRLGRIHGAVDFSVRLTRPAQARRLAEQPFPPLLRNVLEDWARGGVGSGTSPVSSLWLEFDLDRAAEPALPAICAGLSAPAEPAWVSRSLLPLLHGEPLPERQRALVERCCAAIPPAARLLYVFSLRSRGAGEVRLEILGLDPAGIRRYLERIGLPALEPAAAVLPLFAGVERLHLSLDVGERLSPRVGIEGSFVRLPHREPGWEELFDRLQARDLCTPEKRAAAFAWPGQDSARTAPAWPPAARDADVRCVRSLSHVKVVTHPEREPEAKVYLLVTPLRRPPGPVRTPGRTPAG